MARQSEFKPDYEAMTKAQLIEALRLLDEALEAMPEGFALYDKDGRLRLCNNLFRDTYPWAGDLVRPGVTFEELVRAGVSADAYPEAHGQPGDFIADRLAQHKDDVRCFTRSKFKLELERCARIKRCSAPHR